MTENKVKIRPIIENIGSFEDKNAVEKFQNETLRPIIKLQHELLLAFFENHLNKKKIVFDQLNRQKKIDLMSSIFKNDNLFKTELKGLIIGHFTTQEYKDYLAISVDANKRIFTMIKERFLSVFL